jgi:hypothetical protein
MAKMLVTIGFMIISLKSMFMIIQVQPLKKFLHKFSFEVH